ncbi:ZinT/AdcA family metal-binding protein [uncultured Litoreibacter sp.]|uniref:ZinT family metal-binding protein n=1 Tax=uncultured Litoreibacter sp. TaxID=1392394 RepID=UPI0026108008|nr:ZinT/AdcA family metal-binding protein [uncultured Litoreibacter sp.]
MSTPSNFISILALLGIVATTSTLAAETKKPTHTHSHTADDIYKGIFDDAQIQPRPLSDWAGDWQSVYPLLQNGNLDDVMRHKAEHGQKTFDEYKAYYSTGYATDVDRILFQGDTATFFRKGGSVQGQYEDDGFEVLTYDSGRRGVRFVFQKVGGDPDAPDFFQFSDHKIAPEPSDHYHLYWGDDRAALLKELTNWPTYFPASLTPAEISAQMQAH